MMIIDPILIRRPLMKVGGRCEAGFDPERIGAWIGLQPTEKRVTDTCVRTEAAALRAESETGAAPAAD